MLDANFFFFHQYPNDDAYIWTKTDVITVIRELCVARAPMTRGRLYTLHINTYTYIIWTLFICTSTKICIDNHAVYTAQCVYKFCEYI